MYFNQSVLRTSCAFKCDVYVICAHRHTLFTSQYRLGAEILSLRSQKSSCESFIIFRNAVRNKIRKASDEHSIASTRTPQRYFYMLDFFRVSIVLDYACM